jgi:hypothetical protein
MSAVCFTREKARKRKRGWRKRKRNCTKNLDD